MLLISFSFIVLLISLLALGIQILLYREWLKLTKLNLFKSKVNSKNSNNFFTKAGTVKLPPKPKFPPKPNLPPKPKSLEKICELGGGSPLGSDRSDLMAAIRGLKGGVGLNKVEVDQKISKNISGSFEEALSKRIDNIVPKLNPKESNADQSYWSDSSDDEMSDNEASLPVGSEPKLRDSTQPVFNPAPNPVPEPAPNPVPGPVPNPVSEPAAVMPPLSSSDLAKIRKAARESSDESGSEWSDDEDDAKTGSLNLR